MCTYHVMASSPCEGWVFLGYVRRPLQHPLYVWLAGRMSVLVFPNRRASFWGVWPSIRGHILLARSMSCLFFVGLVSFRSHVVVLCFVRFPKNVICESLNDIASG